MLIDKKREEMYFNCRIRKKNLDKNITIIRAILIIPPVLIFIYTAVGLVMSMLGDAAILATGAGLYGYKVNGVSALGLLDLISCAVLAATAACLTVFRTEFVVQKGIIIYSAAVFVFLMLLFIFDYIPMLTYTILAVIAVPLTIWARKLIDEDKKMSVLDGYPHFNPSLMRHTDTPFVPATSEEIDGMTPDERIMYEREH